MENKDFIIIEVFKWLYNPKKIFERLLKFIREGLKCKYKL